MNKPVSSIADGHRRARMCDRDERSEAMMSELNAARDAALKEIGNG